MISASHIKNATYTKTVDVWSLGIIAYEIAFRDWFFKGKDRFEIQENIKSKVFKLHPDQEQKVSEEYADFLYRCLEKDPRLRIKA